MGDQIRDWLQALQLEGHADDFVENGVDIALLPELTNDDLKDLGVGRLADRKRILKAIAALLTPDTGTPPAPAAPPQEAERRQLTVMFCDMVGSTELSQKLDPEDMRETIRRYQDVVADAIARYDGHVAKYLGDGVLAYFGWPRAHEDQAARAIHAGLAAVQAVSDLKTVAGGLAARVGIATGGVVVGDMAGESGAIAGETPNLAARLQAVAEPNQVVIGDNTRQLIGQVFDLDDLGEQRLKGFQGAVSAWAVRGEKFAESRFEAAQTGALTAFVGRTHELGLLLERWQLAQDGDGQVVLVSGEAGIGKSRLTQAMQDQMAGDRLLRLSYQCSPYHTNSAFYPFIQQLEHAAAFTDGDSAAEKQDKLQALFADHAESTKSTVALFAHLLGLPPRDPSELAELSAQDILQRTMRALADRLLALSQQQPVLLMFEDVHWIDPTSLAALELAVREVAESEILMVMTHRPDWQPTFGRQSHITPLQLNRLGRRQATDIVRAVAGTFVDDDTVGRIVERADGIPLFVEEVTKSLVESGLDLSKADIPATLQASLLARLDRIGGTAKEIAQIGAVIGRSFTFRLLSAISGWPDDKLVPALDRLIRSELLQASGTVPEARYTFKHALVRDAAYESMLRETRQTWHAKTGQGLRQMSNSESDTQIEAIASHFENARLPQEASEQWFIAARHAVLRAANQEAVHFSDRALAQLALLPDSQETRHQRLSVLTQKLQPSLSIYGYAAPEVEETSAQALELCREFDDDETLFRVLYYRWVVHHAASRSRSSLNEAQEFYTRAEQSGEETPLLIGHRMLGTSLVMTGSPLQGWQHLAAANRLYVPERHASLRFQFGTDPLVTSLTYSAFATWTLGLYDTARAVTNDLLKQANEIDHIPSSIYARAHSNAIYLVLGFPADHQQHLESLAADLADTPNVLFKSFTDVYLAYFNFMDGSGDVAAVEDAVTGLRNQHHSRVFVAMLRTKMAEQCLTTGNLQDADALIVKAERDNDEGYEVHWKPEVDRLRGECHAAGDSPDLTAAERHYRAALQAAASRGMRALQLRTAVSLARLALRQNQPREAHDALGPALAEITEGDDFPEVVAARALLSDIA